MKTFDDLFLKELRDLHSAERQIMKAMPKMIKAASSKRLKKAFEEHLMVTEKQVERLDEIFEKIGKSSRGPKCEAMEGILAEGQEIVSEDAPAAVKDAALIAAAQRVEHYEISGYGTARTFAQHLGLSDAQELLQQTLDEEKETDVLLTELAESEINVEAEQVS
jgi:ferritin-like metal-binding protein YciE